MLAVMDESFLSRYDTILWMIAGLYLGKGRATPWIFANRTL
ncbi:hypothetical protein [Glaciecola sp. 33A]|nr:hypothetical protein [Glaciecola sp. 33A]